VIAHAFAKSGVFFVVGITQREALAKGQRGALWTASLGGRLLLLGFAALGALPPFGLFCSEFLVALAAIEAHAWAPTIVVALGVIVAFGALIRTGLQVDPTLGAQPRVAGASVSGGATMTLSVASAGVALALAALSSIIPWTNVGKTLATIAGGIG
jgi:hydrogenase-4 component F